MNQQASAEKVSEQLKTALDLGHVRTRTKAESDYWVNQLEMEVRRLRAALPAVAAMEQRLEELEAAIRAWEGKYGWWDDSDSVRTCGFCNEDGWHPDDCPMAVLQPAAVSPETVEED